MINVAVAGSAGRLGSLVAKNVIENSDTHLIQAFDIQSVGSDAGEVAGAGRTGTKITDASDIGDKLDADVLIDFTTADAAMKNIKAAVEKGVPVVVGTTGFNEEQKKQIEEYCQNIPAVISPNFSVGVNVFWKIIEYATKFLGDYDYDIEILEKHHKFKKDAPSGTAIKIAEVASDILKEQGKDRRIVYERSGERKDDEITVLALRGGDVAGEHTVHYLGMGEKIEITHAAGSRQAFAGGAITAARWVVNKSPGLYSMNDVLGF